jgi:hypothetical protein
LCNAKAIRGPEKGSYKQAIIWAWADESKVKTGTHKEHLLFFQSVNQGIPDFAQGKTTFSGHSVRVQLPFTGYLPQKHTYVHITDSVNS